MLKEELIKILENDMIIAYENGIVSRDYTEKNALEIIDAFDKMHQENQQLKEQLEKERKSRKKAIKYLYEHSQYVDEYGIHYIKEDEYCVDYLLDILNIKENK